jgi:hypothetical protein
MGDPHGHFGNILGPFSGPNFNHHLIWKRKQEEVRNLRVSFLGNHNISYKILTQNYERMAFTIQRMTIINLLRA